MASTAQRLLGNITAPPTAPAPAARPVVAASVGPRRQILDVFSTQRSATQFPGIQGLPIAPQRATVQVTQPVRVTPQDVLNEIPGSSKKVAKALLNFGGDIVKGISRPFLRAAKTANSAMQGTAALMAGGVAYATGDKERARRIIINTVSQAAKPTKLPFFGEVTNVRDMTDAVGVGIEIGTTLVGSGVARQALQQGAQQTAKQFVIQALKRGAAEGTITGGLYGLGSGLQQEKRTVKSVATSTAIGGGTGAIFGALFRGLQAKKILGQNAIDDSLKLIPNKSARNAIKAGLEFTPDKNATLSREAVSSILTDVKKQIPVRIPDPKVQQAVAVALDKLDDGQYHTLGELSKAIYKSLPANTPVEARQLIIQQSYQQASMFADPAISQSDDFLSRTFVTPGKGKTVTLFRSDQPAGGNALGAGTYGSTDEAVAQTYANQQGGKVISLKVPEGKILNLASEKEYQDAVTAGLRIAKAQGKLLKPSEAGEAIKLYAQSKGYTGVDASKVQAEIGRVIYDQADDVTRSVAAANATGKTVERTFKVGKYDVGPGEQKILNDTFKALGLGERRVQTFDDVRVLAAELGTSPEDLLKGVDKRLISAAQVKGLRDFGRAQSKIIQEINKKLTNPALTGKERVELQAMASQAQGKLQESVSRVVTGGTEMGRAIAAFRMQAEDINDPLFWYETAKRQLGNKEFSAELRGMIDDMLTKGDKLGLARAIASLHKSSVTQKVITLWKAGLLSNPGTDVANLSGNISMRTAESVKDVPATAIDKIVSLFTGKRTKALSPIVWEEQIKGMFGSGPKRAGEYLRYGIDADELLSKYDFNRNVNFDSKTLQAYTQAVFRRLGAEDLLFREPALRGSIAEQAVVQARNKGLKGRAFTDFVKNLIKNPSDDMVTIAKNDAAYATFQTKSKLASFLTKGAEKGGITGVAIEGIAPFRRTPINVAKAMIDYSPFGLPKAIITAMRDKVGGQAFNQKYFVEGLGRTITGSTILALGYFGAKKGLVSGNYPSDPDQKKMWLVEGKTPNSVKVGDSWYRIDRIAPLAPLFVLGADFHQINNPENESDKLNAIQKVGALASSGLSSFREQTFLKGVAGVGKALDKPEIEGPKYIDSIISSFVPSLLGAIARGIDPNRRAVEGTKEAILSRIPGARQTLEPLINIFGEVRKDDRGLISSLFNPVYQSPIDQQQAAQVLLDAKYAPSAPDARLKRGEVTVELQGPQATQFLVEMGQATKGAILNTSQQPGYASWDQDKKQDELDKAVKDARATVRNSWKDKQIDKASIKLSDDFEDSADSPKGFQDIFSTYVHGFVKDPGNTMKALFTKERIRKITNDATILERRRFLSDLDWGDKNSAIDHVIPLSLGGDNSLDNLQILTNDVKARKDRVEYFLYTLLENGEIKRKEAQERIKNWESESVAQAPEKPKSGNPVIDAVTPTVPQTSTYQRLLNQ